MKEYISRLRRECKTSVLISWWIMRALLLVSLIISITDEKFTLTGRVHTALCLLGTFLWEISLAMPEKSLFRLIPPSIHTVINVGLTASAVLGIGFDMYYSVRFFDIIIHAFFSFVAVLYGYELAYALIKKEHFAATKAMVYFVAFGVGFMLFNAWELGEFFTDQLIGHLTGEVGNAQFWSVALAEGTGRAKCIFPPLVPERAPLMDIMCDVVTHSVSSFAALIFINLCPYRLKGKYKYDTDYGNNIC